MINVASQLARRGFEAFAEKGGDDKVVYKLPTWGALILGATVLLFFAAEFMVCPPISLEDLLSNTS